MTVTENVDTKDLLARGIGPACHELRSPLAVVFGFAKMLETQQLDETARKYLEHVVNGSQRLDDLLDSLSQCGRIAAGRITPEAESLSLTELLEELDGQERVILEPGTELKVRGDQEWLRLSFNCIVEGLCFDPNLRVRVGWTFDEHEVAVSFVPDASFPMVDVDPDKAHLDVAVARMRIVAMGGSLEGHGDRVVATLRRI